MVASFLATTWDVLLAAAKLLALPAPPCLISDYANGNFRLIDEYNMVVSMKTTEP